MSRPTTSTCSSAVTPRELLIAVRVPLLDLHRVLLDAERRQYEAEHGRVTPAELLQLALAHQQFAWLHQVSTVIVRLDEVLAAPEPPGEHDVTALMTHLRTLLRPPATASAWAGRYLHLLQHDPAVLLAHGRVVQAVPPESSATAHETVH